MYVRCDQLKNKSSRRVTYGNPCYSIGFKANSIYFLNDRSVEILDCTLENALFALRAFRFLIANIKIQLQKIHIFSYPPPLFFSILSLLFHMSFIHPIFLPFSLSISSRSFASSLSHYTAYAPHPGPSLFFFRPIPVLSLFVPTSERSLSPQVHRNILCHASLILPVVRGFSDYLPSLLLVGVFVPLAQLHTHPSSFRSHSFYFFAGIPVPPYSPRLFSFLYSTQTVSCTLPFRPFSPRTLRLSFPLSLSTCFSCTLLSLCTLVFLCPLLAPINISLTLSPPAPVPSILRSLLRTSACSPPCSRTSSFSSRTHLPAFSLLFPKRIQLKYSPFSLPLLLAPCLWLSR
jgi:hypothetical protein